MRQLFKVCDKFRPGGGALQLPSAARPLGFASFLALLYRPRVGALRSVLL